MISKLGNDVVGLAVDLLSAHVGDEEWKIVPIPDGKTNTVLRGEGAATGRKVIVRIFGKNSESIIDRRKERENFQELSKYGLAPVLLAVFPTGMIYEYVEGSVLQPEELPIYHREIISAMAQWHKSIAHSACTQTASLFPTLHRWLDLAEGKSPDLLRRYNVRSAIREAEKQMQRLANSPLGMCHNDLLAQNILLKEKGAGCSSAFFIDYEYASINYVSFDIANHFLEYAGFDCDYSKCPAEDFIRNWLELYSHHTGANPIQLREEIEVLTPAAHVYWGLWGVIKDPRQSPSENANNREKAPSRSPESTFDYLKYAEERFKRLPK